jgi:hypothetical protein
MRMQIFSLTPEENKAADFGSCNFIKTFGFLFSISSAISYILLLNYPRIQETVAVILHFSDSILSIRWWDFKVSKYWASAKQSLFSPLESLIRSGVDVDRHHGEEYCKTTTSSLTASSDSHRDGGSRAGAVGLLRLLAVDVQTTHRVFASVLQWSKTSYHACSFSNQSLGRLKSASSEAGGALKGSAIDVFYHAIFDYSLTRL